VPGTVVVADPDDALRRADVAFSPDGDDAACQRGNDVRVGFQVRGGDGFGCVGVVGGHSFGGLMFVDGELRWLFGGVADVG